METVSSESVIGNPLRLRETAKGVPGNEQDSLLDILRLPGMRGYYGRLINVNRVKGWTARQDRSCRVFWMPLSPPSEGVVQALCHDAETHKKATHNDCPGTF